MQPAPHEHSGPQQHSPGDALAPRQGQVELPLTRQAQVDSIRWVMMSPFRSSSRSLATRITRRTTRTRSRSEDVVAAHGRLRHAREGMDEETSIQICGLIAGVLSADEHMHAHEASFLQRVRKRLGLSAGAKVVPVVDRGEAIARLRAFPEDVRAETLELLIQAAAADGTIAPEERAFLNVVADELQVDHEELDERLQAQIATSKPQPFGLASPRDDD